MEENDKKSEISNDDLLEQIKLLKEQNEQKDIELSKITKTDAIKTEILKSDKSPYDLDIVLNLIDYENIKMENNGIKSGFSEQFENIFQNKPFLFNNKNNMENNGIKFKGSEPLIQDEQIENVDEAFNYGKLLAKTNLC